MDPSKIVIVNDTSTARGGATVLALLSLRGFRARGLTVHWLCGDDGDNPELAELGVEVHAAGGAELLARAPRDAARRGICDPDTHALVARYIAQNDEPRTVYHVHSWAQILSPSVFAALRPVADRTFIHAHDMFLACPNGVFMDYRKGTVCPRVPLSLGCVLTNCDKRSYVHKGWRVLRQAMLKRTLRPDAPWGGIVQLHPDMQPRLARAGYPAQMFHTVRNPATPWTEDRIRAEENKGFLYVGRLEPDKGPMELAEAAARVGVPVTFVGDGSLGSEIRARFPQMPVTSWQDRAGIARAARQARALVMPSQHPEPFALVLAEAIHSGLPVATTDIALMAAEIEAAGLGLSYAAGDPAALDAALIRLRDMDATEVREMSERGYRGETRLALSPEDWIEALLALYRGSLRASPAVV